MGGRIRGRRRRRAWCDLSIGMVAGFAVGIAAAAAVHLVFGSPAGRLTLDQVASALVDLDVEATGLRHGALQPRGAAAVTAHDPEGRSLLVKVYGRDAWDGQLLAKAWNSLWYRGDSAHLALGRREQVEHEAFITLLAERGGVSVLPVVAAGMASENDALLVTEVTGRPLAALGADEVDGGLLEHIWDNAARLHDLSIGHGLLDDSLIVIRPDGSPAFGNFSQAEVSASEDELYPTTRASWWRRHCRWESIERLRPRLRRCALRVSSRSCPCSSPRHSIGRFGTRSGTGSGPSTTCARRARRPPTSRFRSSHRFGASPFRRSSSLD